MSKMVGTDQWKIPYLNIFNHLIISDSLSCYISVKNTQTCVVIQINQDSAVSFNISEMLFLDFKVAFQNSKVLITVYQGICSIGAIFLCILIFRGRSTIVQSSLVGKLGQGDFNIYYCYLFQMMYWLHQYCQTIK